MVLIRHPVRLVLVLSLLVAGLPAGIRAAPPPAPPAAPGSAAPLAQSSAAGGTTFTPSTPLTPIPEAPEYTGPQITFEQMLAFMEKAGPILGDLQKSLDHSQFDLNALGTKLEYDAESILAYLRREIAFEQYPGVLRGEQGTLVGRAGNAFDQALLARRLLEDAGYETRLVRTTLSEVQARALVAEMARHRSAAPPAVDPEALSDAESRLRAASPLQPQAGVGASAFEGYALTPDLVDGDVALILQGLRAAGVTLGHAGAVDELLREARDYLWVQYRLGPYDKWIDAHPAYSDPAAAPKGLKFEQVYRDTLPADLYHRLCLTVTVEQMLGDKLVTTPVVSGWERTSAELFGHPVAFQQMPNNLEPPSRVDTETLLQEAGVFIPVIDGQMGGRVFDLRGNVYDAGLQGLGAISAAMLGTSLGSAAGGALGGLGGEGVAAGTPELTAEWIDYTLVAPGGAETRFRRTVLDRVGGANRFQGKALLADTTPLHEAAKALLTGYSILVLPGEYSAAYGRQRTIGRAQAEIRLGSALETDGTLSRFPADELSALTSVEDALLSNAFAVPIRRGSSTLAYRATPSLVVMEQGLRPGRAEETSYQLVDVIHNARRVFSVTGGSMVADPEEAVRIGAWETLAERAALTLPGEPFGTLEVVRRAVAAGIPLRALKPGDGAALQGLAHSAQTKAGVQRDLDAGYVVILPEGPAAGSEPTSWWRVNPETGETLGLTTGGTGAAYIEYVAVLALLVVPVLVAVYLYQGVCMGMGGSTGCCLLQGAISTLSALPSLIGWLASDRFMQEYVDRTRAAYLGCRP